MLRHVPFVKINIFVLLLMSYVKMRRFIYCSVCVCKGSAMIRDKFFFCEFIFV